jgi:Na+/melibiose symporter-like transporter
MRICFSAIPVAGTFLALLVLRSYPLTRQRVEEIQVTLTERRALAAAPAAGTG